MQKAFFDSASSQAFVSLLLIASYTSSHYKCQNEMIPINWVHLIFVKSIFYVIERPRTGFYKPVRTRITLTLKAKLRCTQRLLPRQFRSPFSPIALEIIPMHDKKCNFRLMSNLDFGQRAITVKYQI